jgi:iron complex transport system ATP-binding protein
MGFLDIENVHYSIGESKILDNVTIEFTKGRFYSIVGPNGSGKTTLLKNIIKSINPTKGLVVLDGQDMKSMKAKEVASKIGYVPQNTSMELDFTCYDVVMMGRSHKLKGFQNESKSDVDSVINAMKVMDTLHLKDKFITEISGGERQRVILARAIAQDGECIILDEPISHLDIKHQISVLEQLQKLKKSGKTIITVLHDLNFALNYSEEVILMKEGGVYSKGEVDKVLTSEHIKNVYGVNSEIITLKGKKQIIF